MTAQLAAMALNRFGLGARRGDTARIAADPKGALLAELYPATALLSGSELQTTPAIVAGFAAFQMEKKAARATPPGDDATMAPGMKAAKAGKGAQPKPDPVYATEVAARVERTREADIGYVERLVAFWTNHFAVKAGAGAIPRQLAGAFEREAIRPYVLGKFADMLVAVTQHPAMLTYLNNATSIGPDSPAGRNRGRGLNENHARELMELHTIGVNGGYTQADVIAGAKILSGWSISRPKGDRMEPGHFIFRANAHEPGPQTVMGRTYDAPGERQGLALLADLALSQATADHVAIKLARSFVADEPPPELVANLSGVFQSTHGDLMQVSRALVESDAAWTGKGRFRTPQQFVWSTIRALDVQPKAPLVTRMLRALGQAPWDPPSPAGYDETMATWLAPDAMTSRLDAAQQIAAMTEPTIDPAALVDDLFGGAASKQTREAVSRAESQQQGLALMLMSPEFQRI